MPRLDSTTVIGRFAPSPTGPLHLGSIYTALASFLHARSQQGKWLLRIDDLDTPRNIKGADASILTTLETFGLHWDDSVVYQHQTLDVYNDRLNELIKNHQLYPCTCSRKNLSSPIYSGLCRHKSILPESPYALRLKTESRLISFEDGLQGLISHNVAEQDGDFILKRKDGIIAYQFAVVIDDYQQGVNQVVRGFDLLTETPKQIYLQQLLGLPTPDYLHVPIIVDAHGYKLSKQTQATAVNLTTPSSVIFALLQLLKQNPPLELQPAPVAELINWAVAHWQPASLKNVKQLTA
ncbi:MAG: tRNA glutamyl-Q(34) synthetase GluQRS [Methylococcaceae bacterium]|nr:tRNA glutamyl-Q(34) synthetase GluQRS [Methylococcaceae bacterium]